VENVPRTVPLHVSFRRGLVNENLHSLYDFMSKVARSDLTTGRDLFRWNLAKNDGFTLPFMYGYD
jgi:hypothetical protein